MKGTCSFTMDLGVILSFLLIGSVFYHKFGLYMGFSLKPFMITLAIVFFFCLAQRVKLISKLYLYESLFLVFLLYSTLRGLFSQDLVSFFRLVLGFVIVLSYYWFTSSLTSKLSADKIANILLLSGFFFLLASYLLYFLEAGLLWTAIAPSVRHSHRSQSICPFRNSYSLRFFALLYREARTLDGSSICCLFFCHIAQRVTWWDCCRGMRFAFLSLLFQ